jgi:type I restriction enzyme R subunit
MTQVNLTANLCFAVREYLPDDGSADYVLIVNKKLVWIIEAKRTALCGCLSVLEEQTENYALAKLKQLDNGHFHLFIIAL